MVRIPRLTMAGEPAAYHVISRTALDGFVLGEDEQLFRELIHLRCPQCGERLAQREVHEVAIDECPGCQGIWLDKGEFEALSQHRGNEWVAQFMQRLTHLLTHPTS